MSKVFISYRRNDTSCEAGRIFDYLENHFGESNIFIDFSSIKSGVNFKEEIVSSIHKCNVFLIVIGDKWIGEKNDKSLRINDKDDYVRIEIENAFKINTPVIPVLIDKATIPNSDALPSSIKNVSAINACNVRLDSDFSEDMKKLTSRLEELGVEPVKNKKDYVKIEDVVSFLDDLKYVARYFFETIPKSEVMKFFHSLQNFHIGTLRMDHADMNLLYGTDYLMRVVANGPLRQDDYNSSNLGAATRCYKEYAKKKNLIHKAVLENPDRLDDRDKLATLTLIFESVLEKDMKNITEKKLCNLVLSIIRYLTNVRRKKEILDYSANDVGLLQDYVDFLLKDKFSFRLPMPNEDLSQFKIFCQD